MSENVVNIAKSELASDQKLCSSCNSIIKIKAEICPHCGVRQRNPVSKTALLLITFFVGWIGGHKFYLGKTWQGVLYLLFFWTGITSLIALIEFIIYIFTSSERLNEKYSADGSTVFIVLICVFVAPTFLILTSIAIPAYFNYAVRAKVEQGLVLAESAKVAVATNGLLLTRIGLHRLVRITFHLLALILQTAKSPLPILKKLYLLMKIPWFYRLMMA